MAGSDAHSATPSAAVFSLFMMVCSRPFLDFVMVLRA